jgi:hypothetical protein
MATTSPKWSNWLIADEGLETQGEIRRTLRVAVI